ncbi:cephalosporin hydroxylase family protein [Paraliomyxa miuraensis]|uniref:cephalosporin hydroxylase family protein n=1 Tax=Paraliomyxa miuraensis TaxID=376150 RepID=UPI00225A4001|nr:CmcI family methyltransferase [Paraliomyxa miuraensis]MCX4240437.1 cephalosporin hydroxylase family protein [Paraliomyxa miuraensis]
MRPSEQMKAINLEWLRQAAPHGHLYQHRWLGERFFHLPGDMIALQEILTTVRPRLVIHTGIAAGGGPIFLASILELCGGDGMVVAIDPALRPEGRKAITEHPLARRIEILEGSSIDPEIVAKVSTMAAERSPVVVVLDLIHTQAHVEKELERLGPLATPGSYVVVLDTVMEDLPAEMFAGKPYGKGNNPGTAVRAFLQRDDRFEVDYAFEDRVLLTLAPGGFLRRRADAAASDAAR